MIKPEMVPDEVVEAMAVATFEANGHYQFWPSVSEGIRNIHRRNACIAARALLRSWPGMKRDITNADLKPCLILPLPLKENENG